MKPTQFLLAATISTSGVSLVLPDTARQSLQPAIGPTTAALVTDHQNVLRAPYTPALLQALGEGGIELHLIDVRDAGATEVLWQYQLVPVVDTEHQDAELRHAIQDSQKLFELTARQSAFQRTVVVVLAPEAAGNNSYNVIVFGVDSGAPAARLARRALFRLYRHLMLKKAFLYNRLNKSLELLNSHVKELLQIARDAVERTGTAAADKGVGFTAAVKEIGLRMLFLPTMLVRSVNVRSDPGKNMQKRGMLSESDFSTVAYAFQRLDGNAIYGPVVPGLMDSKHRIYEDGIVARADAGQPSCDSSESPVGAHAQAAKSASVTASHCKEPEVHPVQPESDPDPADPSSDPDPDSSLEPIDEEPCVAVTWYTIFHHSVFGTPKLCQK
ncbi:hypothetical protein METBISCDRAFT_28675 [Metschnikowia bicuspidata]|uniref:Uncharacterized protein n=1 Tax=Metschnikowia bicuspidata TaxID=27322 RepID=A0A4P9Z9E8_9ASCO|nr:hypothetical protein METBISCDRAFT_28675 [Metschnikowia bicuspidata]